MPLIHCFGGGGGTPDIPAAPTVEQTPTPTKQATKSVSAGAQAAAEAQRERSRRNRGLAASILTSRSGLSSMGDGSDTLG